jgi:predicted TIM-barrel fold metal-dependent hydrolase
MHALKEVFLDRSRPLCNDARTVMIDFHTHILPPSFRGRQNSLRAQDATFGTLFAQDNAPMATMEQLIEAMDADGVDASVVLGYGWRDRAVATESNDYLLDAARRYPDRIYPYCSVDPNWGDAALAEVERCVAQGARGIGELHPTSQGLDLAEAQCLDPFMALAQERELPVLVHGSEPVGHSYAGKGDTGPAMLMRFIHRYPQATIICAHWGGGLPFYGLMPEVRQALANTYFDTATTQFLYHQEVFSTVVKAVGAERLLFGSDYPLLRAKRVAEQATASLKSEGEALQALLHDNAARLLTGRG